MKTSAQVISELKELIRSKGYIYSLCILLFDEFHIIVDRIHEQNPHLQLSMNEALFLVGLLAQDELDFSLPSSPQQLFEKKRKTTELLNELHMAYRIPFLKAMEEVCVDKSKMPTMKDMFGSGEMLVEAIHYAGTGAYDFQLVRLLERKYKFDLDWLLHNRGYSPQNANDLFTQVKSCLDKKSKRVNLFVREIPDEKRKEIENNHPANEVEQFFEASELMQYADLFEFELISEKDPAVIKKYGFGNFCKNLLDLFVVTPQDVSSVAGGHILLELFSCTPSKSTNTNFNSIGSYNQCRSHPFLKVAPDRFFLPVSFFLAEALYESPGYWMIQDNEYRSRLSKNRGDAGEELVFDFLTSVFGPDKVFRSVKVETRKGCTETDIDVLCILGNKALCVQVKSKKLTELSRLGDDKKLQEDFQAAVQDAFDQGQIARNRILNGGASFIDNHNQRVGGLEFVNEVYILVITTENYPSLALQSRVLLKKEVNAPSPMVMTVFDLELVAHYLNNPYEFLYYVRQRVSLADYIVADEESVILTYHLQNKLWKEPEENLILLDAGLAEILSQDYFPKNLGIEVDGKSNPLSNRWKDESFDDFIDKLSKHRHPKITDIVFHLFDFSGDMRKELMKLIAQTRAKSESDGKMHSFSIPPDATCSSRLGITFMSIKSDDEIGPAKRLSVHVELSKYKHKADIWIGFCSLIGSETPIDFLVVIERLWQYDKKLEAAAAHLGDYSLRTKQV